MFTDSHCHLDFDELNGDYLGLLSECEQKNIHQIIIPSISPDNWHKVLNCASALSEKQAPSPPPKKVQCFPALGIHPWFLGELNHNALDALSQHVKQHRQHIVAIGETGIDIPIAKKEHNLPQQRLFFEGQIAIAKAQNLPLILHHRQSHELILKQLKHDGFQGGGILHAFSGSYEQAKQYIDLGFYIGVGGTITYPRAQKTIKAIAKLPLDALVLETDAPAMPLYGFQGSVNTPLHVVDVFKALEAIRPEKAEIIAQMIEINIQAFLALSQANSN